jgi:DNA (cytosine-5)-methyltransferase 1
MVAVDGGVGEKMTEPLSVVSLFSGPGGSSLGYKRAGCDVIGAVDCAPEGYTRFVLDTYKANHDTPLFEWDVTETSGQDLLDATGIERGELGILDGSPPCSPFSSANTSGDGGFDSDEGTLFDEYVRLVDALEPRYFVAENVPRLASKRTAGYFKQLCDDLRNAGRGYSLTVRKIEAHKLGSPHYRTRLIFVGSRRDVPEPEPIVYTHTVALRDALRGVENGDWELEEATDKLHHSRNASVYKDLAQDEHLDKYRNDRRGNSHKRLCWDEPVKNPTSVIGLAHPAEDRFITLSELKRIMDLPDDYTLCGDSFNQRWETAIRCLPPVLIETVAQTIIDAQSGTERTDQRPVTPND